MYNCKISQSEQILMNKNFDNLKQISEETGLSYNQVADLSSRPIDKSYQKYKYYPKIVIKKIDKNSIVLLDQDE